ncbi:MAG TPA: hypothetical protein VLE22_11640 [Bryobacteraceae bacterium]|nr:hypothetical protein [Bryobacteraceae bacterium]
MMAAVAFLVSIATGWLVVDTLLRPVSLRPRWAARVLTIALGAGIGAGATSVLYFLVRSAGLAGRGLLFAADLMLFLAGGAVWLVFRDTARPVESPEKPGFRWNAALAGALTVGFLLVVLAFLSNTEARIHGDWDAWSTWNVRAKFLAADGEEWRNAWSPLLAKTHPDYPLLLPGFVARAWRYGGKETPPAVPAAAAFLFFAGTFAVLVSGFAVLRSTSLGLLAGCILLASTGFLSQGTSQYADVPMGFYILGTVVLLSLTHEAAECRANVLALAGATASLAAWTKNEGLLFLACSVAGICIAQPRSRRVRTTARLLAWFIFGSLPGLLVTLWFKLALAPNVNPLTKQSVFEAMSRLAEADRYFTIARALLSELLMLGDPWTHPLLLLAILAATLRFIPEPERRGYPLVAEVTLALLVAGSAGAYLTTPSRLSISLGRIFAQVWPAAILLVLAALRPPEATTTTT